eukprot:TRINITY_DN3734_c0_g1_i4.p1 TRINITY_DN3734_c0_g1~~TRINITY_DN3734_c0_g1_i4.p1  ORF type:complete len:706 (-),score=120.31 TRINITY_DN3734_c0_g1_i4:81-2198(-)
MENTTRASMTIVSSLRRLRAALLSLVVFSIVVALVNQLRLEFFPRFFAVDAPNTTVRFPNLYEPGDQEQLLHDQFSAVFPVRSVAQLPHLAHLIRHYDAAPQLNAMYLLYNTDELDLDILLASLPALRRSLIPVATTATSLLVPLPALRTNALLYIDSTEISLHLLNSAFEIWKDNPERLVGFFPRTHFPALNSTAPCDGFSQDLQLSEIEYGESDLQYSLLRAKILFVSQTFLQVFLRGDPELRQIAKTYHCDELALNFLVANLTGRSPLLVTEYQGEELDDGRALDRENLEPGKREPNALWTKCLHELTSYFGGVSALPLKTARFALTSGNNEVAEQSLCQYKGELVSCKQPFLRSLFSLRSRHEIASDNRTHSRSSVCRLPRISDQFSLVFNGFSPNRLNILIRLVRLYAQSPHVHTIYILWNNMNVDPPNPLMFGLGPVDDPNAATATTCSTDARRVPALHIVRMERDSLNNRFRPLPGLATDAVMILDDDIEVTLPELHQCFYTWQGFPDRVVGFYPRTHVRKGHEWRYRQRADSYSIILTKMMIIGRRYLDLYTESLPAGVREFVDEGTNCEDLAMNFLVAATTGRGPVLVDGWPQDYGDSRTTEAAPIEVPPPLCGPEPTPAPAPATEPGEGGGTGQGEGERAAPQPENYMGLGARASHADRRSECLNVFGQLWNTTGPGLPLRYTRFKAVALGWVGE